MALQYRLCSSPHCGTLHQGTGRCGDCQRAADRQRPRGRNPYSTKGHKKFRALVLARDPLCVCQGDCGRHASLCAKRATVADHHPYERQELIDLGWDPNGAEHGRGLCAGCHSAKTARTRPGGWHANQAAY